MAADSTDVIDLSGIDAISDYAPVLTVMNQAVERGQTLQMSDLISATDPDGRRFQAFPSMIAPQAAATSR